MNCLNFANFSCNYDFAISVFKLSFTEKYKVYDIKLQNEMIIVSLFTYTVLIQNYNLIWSAISHSTGAYYKNRL